MEENRTVDQQPEDTMLYPMVDASLEKDLSIQSGSAIPSVDDLMNPSETAMISQQPPSTSPSQQVVSTSVTTSGSNPLQVSVKTVPGTNTIVNQALINNIINSEAVQALLRDNPGQPITIVRMPEALQLPKLNFPFTPINNLNLNNLKTRKRNGTTLSLRGKRGRKHKIGGTQEEKTNFLQFQKSLQIKTRSGRVSKPPLYRVKETLRKYSGQQSSKPKDAGAAVEMDSVNINSQQNRSPLKATGHTTTSTDAIRGQHSARKGHRGFRGYSRGRRRARGRIGNFGNRLSSSDKLKDFLTEIPDEDLISLTMPRLLDILSPWDFLLMRAFKKRKTEPDKISFEVLLKEFEDLLNSLKIVSRVCLVSERGTPDQAMIELSGELAGLFGTSKGYIWDICKESLPSSVVKLMESSFESDKRRTAIDEDMTDMDDTATPDPAAAQSVEKIPKSTKIGDKILGVDTIFPDNALKSSVTDTIAETAASKLSVPTDRRLVQVESCSEASVDESGLIVNVEELDSTVLHSRANDLNLNQVVEPVDSSVPLESDHTDLHVPSTALSIQVPANTPTETVPMQEQSHSLSDRMPPVTTSTSSAESVQEDSSVIQAMVPEALPSPQSLQPTTTPMVPEGSTILQMTDGNFLVQKPDGTAMQIQAPEGMTIETIQALLTVEMEVYDQGDPVRPGEPDSMETTDHIPFLSVEDSVNS